MDSPVKVKGALRRLHLGPGDHPSGSPQSVHAGRQAVAFNRDRLDDLARGLSETGSVRKDKLAQEFIELNMEAHLGRSVSMSLETIDKVSYAIGFVIRDGGGVEMTVQIGETTGMSDNRLDSEMLLTWIEANKKGTGMGTAFMRTMKAYADAKGENFRVAYVTNHKFYRNFGWLKEIETGIDYGEFVYETF